MNRVIGIKYVSLDLDKGGQQQLLTDQVMPQDLQEHRLDTVCENGNIFREIAYLTLVNRERWMSRKREVHL